MNTKRKQPAQRSITRRTIPNALSLPEEAQLNSEAYRRIRREAEQLPTKWLPGQYVALLQGEVVAQSFDADEVFSALDQLEPDHRRGMIFQVGVDYDHIQEL